MSFSNFKNKFFLDMSKAEMISHSIVIVDNTKIVPNQTTQMVGNPFGDLSSKIALKDIVTKACGEAREPVVENSSFEPSYIFGNLLFKISSLPPRVIVQETASKLSENLLPNIYNQILIALPEIEEKVEAVGINFELFIPNEDDAAVKEKIFSEKAVKNLESMTTTLVYKIDDDCKLNLTIADADYKEKKGIYFKANFHNKITATIRLKDIIASESSLLKDAKSRIEKLLSDSNAAA